MGERDEIVCFMKAPSNMMIVAKQNQKQNYTRMYDVNEQNSLTVIMQSLVCAVRLAN